ncbi:helix-hairpin-helix domain-containing protein [Lactobacillus kefiranofaciens]|uniref:Competence protein ComEA n=1 Tax=Lactobacillus kefiranofaciens TaxID=267818 RepID=A0AAX3UEQ2_9LACO|nr:helix-hairpin-helix domain-containing protein [Lactobacillus kefiranofaciens]AEG40506.1 Competence protein ComEA [Lactobacillus kefiranofaciens subsp. kefiranofaciens]KRM22529.1 competence protein ComEA [Lactobacillus kefiranofaciens subsp. kefiranofaciens DSM 5016 = JCM 6985]QFQ68034.1 ComEA family DNA-binding protein [Lactobacillus kefiranofaciens subsp. kefiranofaciens]WGO86190.1 helix-hairpin-helix domain-containing protein [Lactobacillus kefiranofaciens]WQH36491.1 helix-hairpin-helix d
MNFNKIKEVVVEKKIYIIATIVLVAVLGLKKSNNQESVAEVNNEKVMQSSNTASSNNSNASSMASSASSSSSKTVTCDISGAVKHQGVYTLKNGARLQELIEAAGGTTAKAQLKAINRAVLLKDQDKIHIPYKGEKVESVSTVTAGSDNSREAKDSAQSGSNGEKVNLNTASAADLQKLTGVGEKKAEQIIAYREQNGSFKKIEDLMQVSGIGEKTFESLKDQLAV